MSKSSSGLFHGTTGDKAGRNSSPMNGLDYNTAHSNSVRKVEFVTETHNTHSISPYGVPNSVTRSYKGGRLTSERYYDSEGQAYLDIDYSNHGNARTHPIVPHEHDITFDDSGNMHRGKDFGIR